MKYIILPDLLKRLEEMKQSHPEFSPLLDQIAADAVVLPSVDLSGYATQASYFIEKTPGMKGEPMRTNIHPHNPNQHD